MKPCVPLLLLFFISSGSLAAQLKLEVQGIDGELKDNVDAIAAGIDVSDGVSEQQIRRQFRSSINKALRAKGYYEPRISFDAEKNLLNNKVLVATIDAGEPIRLEAFNINVTGDVLQDSDYQRIIKKLPKRGDILDHGQYEAFKSKLVGLALHNGYFDAELKRSELAVAPSLYQAFWNIDYNSGPRYRFGKVNFVDSQIKEEYLQNLIPFEEGEPYSSEKLAVFNQRLSSTNWFNSIIISPDFTQQSEEKVLPINTLVSPRSKNMMELGGGYSSDIGPRVKANWKRPWINSRGQSLEASTTISRPEQSIDLAYKIPLKQNPLEHYYLLQAGYKREDHNDTRSDITTFNVARHWDLSTGWQRSVNLRWSLDHFTQADETHTTQLLYPGVNISRTRQRGGLMPRWGDSQRYSADISNTVWGSDIDFTVLQTQGVLIRTFADDHRFVTRVNIGWIDTNSFSKVPPSLRFFAGGDRSIRGYKYKSISPVDSEGKLTGGSKLATASAEYQYNVTGKWWGATFFDAGESVHSINSSDVKKGAGVGVRWESPVGPIKFDIAKPIGEKDENKREMQFYIGLGPEL